MNTITDQEFNRFQRFIYDAAGITMASSKKALVSGRLSKRLQARQLKSFTEYFNLLSSGQAKDEVQTAIDLLTTNETYFFREPKHFELLKSLAQAHKPGQPFRVWSAASSTGEEAYSMAMVLADTLGNSPWEILGSDISTRVLQRARAGHFPMERARNIPQPYLKRYCLKGFDEQEGTMLVEKSLRQRVRFFQANLNEPLPQLGQFDVIFLRNVMIYFNGDTKRQVVARVISMLKPGGYFCIGHSESLNDISDALLTVAPSIYRKP
ncbi:protein-glutamate O-methyltransferase CheR [Aquabacterium sp. CECT 9606]|uniref:CheR family methyltransferase n=1 Tax=Aquabacterium sp. CECT 9606 TaxID=2845822 RepID=UPI001E33510B|nr:protein-glutamate O-methyltransferase [Aquabacterium sp. CECT 9606]CAH0355719.1 Chemotaxis protein methyltransferase [Aquabacterium sp. CECT 9606]